tara:strand:- start:3948 stop:4802 length:855 start_codon:yes stop_codon:yes gene_type:complete
MLTMNLNQLIKDAILEDAPSGDITVTSLFKSHSTQNASLIAKQDGIFFGSDIIQAFFSEYDPNHQLKMYVKDGDHITKNTCICDITSKFDRILLVERSMLNLIQRLSGIATLTNLFVKKLDNPNISICDTRKTMIGLRTLEKAAVKAGGGVNHRFGLSDMILIKENHLTMLKKNQELETLTNKIKQAKSNQPKLKAQIEIETLDQLRSLDLKMFDFIMLDNFSYLDIPIATKLCRERYPNSLIEISGNVTLETIDRYKPFDIDRISIGSLTHSVAAFDISLLLT